MLIVIAILLFLILFVLAPDFVLTLVVGSIGLVLGLILLVVGGFFVFEAIKQLGEWLSPYSEVLAGLVALVLVLVTVFGPFVGHASHESKIEVSISAEEFVDEVDQLNLKLGISSKIFVIGGIGVAVFFLLIAAIRPESASELVPGHAFLNVPLNLFLLASPFALVFGGLVSLECLYKKRKLKQSFLWSRQLAQKVDMV